MTGPDLEAERATSLETVPARHDDASKRYRTAATPVDVAQGVGAPPWSATVAALESDMVLPPRWSTSPYAAAAAASGTAAGETVAGRDPDEAVRPGAACTAPVPGSPAIVVERVDDTAAAAHREAWLDLMDRALEPQVFFDPDFVLPAALHLPRRSRPDFLLIWSGEARGLGDLIGICPIVDRPDPLRALASAWHHDLSALAFPLLDAKRAVAAWRALLSWAGEGLPKARGLVIPSLPADGPTAKALRTAAGTDFAVEILDSWERAALQPAQGRAGLSALSSKGAKELRRQRRRLADQGTLAYASVRDGDALRDGVEQFLALEAAGWKGVAKTALLGGPATTAFARTATRLLGDRTLCRVDALTLDGEPIAMAVILTAGPTDFLWKIAYREDLGRFSPGVQLVLDITEAQLRDRGIGLTDSCAIPRHPMIDRLWRDRLTLATLAVATRPGRSFGFALAVRADRTARRLRAGAKHAVLAVRAWRARSKGAAAQRTTGIDGRG